MACVDALAMCQPGRERTARRARVRRRSSMRTVFICGTQHRILSQLRAPCSRMALR
jgi:hypothetical protein